MRKLKVLSKDILLISAASYVFSFAAVVVLNALLIFFKIIQVHDVVVMIGIALSILLLTYVILVKIFYKRIEKDIDEPEEYAILYELISGVVAIVFACTILLLLIRSRNEIARLILLLTGGSSSIIESLSDSIYTIADVTFGREIIYSSLVLFAIPSQQAMKVARELQIEVTE